MAAARRGVVSQPGHHVRRGQARACRDELRDDGPPRGIAEGRIRLQRGHPQDELHALPVPGHLHGIEAVELDDRLAERVDQRRVRRGRRQQLAQPEQVFLEVTPDQVVLGGEVAEEGTAADARGRGDVVHRGVVEALKGEQLEPDPLQLGP